MNSEVPGIKGNLQMKALKKFLRILGYFLAIIIIFSLAWWFWPERTPKIKSGNENSIATIDYIRIGGLEQCVLIRSRNINNPVVLFLHGGPGMPMMYLAHEFQRPLEDHFTVVQWDRRGAGKTFFRNKASSGSMNTRQLIDDAFELIDSLRKRFNRKKVILVGHSFGTHLGSIMVNERPELFSAYISIGQVVDDDRAAEIQKSFIREKASYYSRDDILKALDASDRPNFENWLFEFGGELKNSKSFFPLIWSGLKAPEYTLPEALKLSEGSSFSSSNFKENVLSENVFTGILEYHLPVFFFVGNNDYTTPHQLISEYYNRIKAPYKELVYFHNSAHFPFFEEPDRFCREIKRILLDEKWQEK